MKRHFLASILALALMGPSFAAGTIPGISMTQQLDELARPLAGGKLFLIQAGTTSTPQNCYQDTSLTLAWPNPLTLDAAGRVPQVFCADGIIKIRLTDKNGNQKLIQDNLLVVGPSGGGGGGGTVDPTTIASTGDMKVAYGTSVLTGWVRANGRTIGSATSGATERANADTQSLFQYLWGADANLAVSAGRGASAAADWAANKTIALPDLRGRVIAGLDDMGNSSASRLNAVMASTLLGAAAGVQTFTLTTPNLPPYTPSGSVAVTGNYGSQIGFLNIATLGPSQYGGTGTGASLTQPIINGTFTGTAQGGSSTPFSLVQPTLLATYYLKL
ncbi:hypothetical protein BSZ19_46930 [Bradyrhizobium japonicum]|uniref:Microcystin-dependent protein n=1 Tax=Bradyrhizobium japonicum TaxID=375 RepID=A0A1Y2J7V2_BRAJP|nr:hypothetical protein [Bradyrhizobium japonicum]OSJ22129.1 hypothetical protein BSZ19_46930 [Bradyrhizobium japonicum]